MLKQHAHGYCIKKVFKYNEVYKTEERLKILLVEDNELIGKINLTFLNKLGFNVDIAKNGCEAVKLLKDSYDLFLLDVGLPDIDGIRVCEIIRSLPKFSHTPVIFLTAFGEGLKDECIAAGGNDFAVKPLPMEELQRLIDKWLLDNNNN
jgi:CheY-like chemotaxis protein